MSKPIPRQATVIKSERLTPSIQRIVLGGQALQTFPATKAGAYVKLLFDTQGNPVTAIQQDSPMAMRTYTVRHFDNEKARITLDFVLHSESGVTGPASAWAMNAKEGDSFMLAGPGSSKGLAEQYDWVLFAGDLTALPSITNHLAALPEHVTGTAVIAIRHPDDKMALDKPKGVNIIWIDENHTSLHESLQKVQWQAGLPAAWVACEFSDMRAIRGWLTKEKQLPHEQVYISSYWKKGRSEDQHKIEKRQDSEAFAALA